MIRDMFSSSTQLLVALFLIMALCKTCNASDGRQTCSSLCGDHNIKSPFRLKDSPEQCGDQRYNLSCEQNQLVMYWQSGRYSVLSIDYENYTIRLRDANIVELDSSSLPEYSLTDYNFSKSDPYTSTIDGPSENGDLLWYELYTSMMMIYVRCEHPLDSPGFVDTAPCFKISNGSVASSSSSSSNLYAYVGMGIVAYAALDDNCRIEMMYMTSWPALKNNQSWSCTDIHNMLLYGFELSWLKSHSENSIFEMILRSILNYRIYFALSVLAYIGAKFVLATPFLLGLLIYKWQRRHLSVFDNIEDFLQSENNIIPIRYSYNDLKKMTNGFKVRLGKGGYGSVFKGQLRSGCDVAVKMLNNAKANGQDFINEVATVGRIHHVNVVQLIGYCVEGSNHAIIYEFMKNGSLDKYILSKPNHYDQSLNLHQLYAISLGVARGIEYLHKGCDVQILHFDIKPPNILLDDNFIPKVSDFGLAGLYPTNNSIVPLTTGGGTIGYMAPELFYRNAGVSCKADVYSFGKLLMEIAGRRKNLSALTEESSQFYFPFWVYDQLNEGNEIDIADTTEEEMKVARKMMIVGLWCIQTKPSDRPSMTKVVEMLERDEQDLELPQKPYGYPQDLPARDDSDLSSSICGFKSSNHPSTSKDVEMLEGEEQEQDSPKNDVDDHFCSPPPVKNNPKETTSFLSKEDERSI